MKAILLLFLLATSAVAGPTTVTLACSANPPAEKILSYVWYEHVGTTFTLLGTTAVPTFSFPIPAGNTQHQYCVSAKNAVIEGPKSADVILPILPTAPQSVILVVQ